MTNASKLADKYFADQCKRLGALTSREGCSALTSHDRALYNQATDLIVASTTPAKAGVKAVGKRRKRRKLPQHVQNRMSAAGLASVAAHEAGHAKVQADVWPTPRTYEQVFGRGKTSVVYEDSEAGRLQRWADVQALEDIYAVLKGEK